MSAGRGGGSRCGWVLFVLLCLGTGPASGETLTIATYNVENYVAANRLVEGVYREGYPKPEAQKEALRAVIRGVAADIVVLQEMGAGGYLEELRRDLAQEGAAYPYWELLEADDKDRHLAALSRRPFVQVSKHTDLSFKYFDGVASVKRGLLELRVATEAGELTLFVVHLKSRFTDRVDDPESALRRAGEAVAVRDEVLRVFPEPALARFVILGDCNDGRSSRPLRALAARGKTQIAEALSAADSRGETWTHWYRKEQTYSGLDHILISAPLKPAVQDGRARIYDASATAVASDHRPVVVTLKLEK
jgi:endonuclease/exonuclease/phosphatase family metal-dependent hydrolase